MASFSQREQMQRKNSNFSSGSSSSAFSPNKRTFSGQQSFTGVTLKKPKFSDSNEGSLTPSKNTQKSTFPSLTSFAQTSKENQEQNPVSKQVPNVANASPSVTSNPKVSNIIKGSNHTIETKSTSNSVKTTPKLCKTKNSYL
jgi:hypothetical protein